MRRGSIRIGCSGWQYAGWRGRFYPATLAQARWLPYYAARFDTVEVNNTFYRLPEAATFAAWRAATPSGFLMAVKASRFLTHIKRLRDPAGPLALLFSRALALGPRLGPVLYQLPATQQYDRDRLRTFLDALPATSRDVTLPAGAVRPRLTFRHVLEFRHPSWYRDDVFGWIEAAGATVCLHDKTGAPFDETGIGRFVYQRFHGTSGHYHGSYPTRVLGASARRLDEAARRGRDVYVYFNNDPEAAAVRNARTLTRLIAGAGVSVRSGRAGRTVTRRARG